jgi:hypothetical protein
MSKSLDVLKVKDIKNASHKLDKTLPEVLPKHPFSMLIVAPPKSGKSSLIANLLANPNMYNAEEYFDEIYYISPTQMQDNTTKHYLKKLDNVIQIHEHDDIMHLETIIKDIIKSQKELEEEKEPKQRILLVLDDCIGYMDKNNELIALCSRYRHWGLSIIIVSQQYRKIPLLMRNCAGNIIFFKLNNEKELEKIDDEFGQNFSGNFIEIAKFCTKEKYNFCYLDNENLKIWHNFKTMVLDASK